MEKQYEQQKLWQSTEQACTLPHVSGCAYDWKTVYITIIDKHPDNLGRQHFWTQWMSETIGKHLNETGLRGQMSFCNLNESLKYWQNKGYKIEYFDSLRCH